LSNTICGDIKKHTKKLSEKEKQKKKKKKKK